MFCWLLIGALLAPPEDDKFDSENRVNLKGAAPVAKAKPAAKKERAVQIVESIAATDVAKLARMDGKSATVRGKVVSLFSPKSGEVLVLNFGKDTRQCFKVAVFKRSFDKFDGGLAGLKKLQGKTVVVEGDVAIYKGAPQIVAGIPSQIKVGD